MGGFLVGEAENMAFRPITPTVHGILDYVSGASLLAAPAVLGLQGRPSGLALRAVGTNALVGGAITKSSVGVVKVVPLKAHLAMDAVTGVALAASPWLLGFKGEKKTGARSWVPHVVVGASLVGGALLTRSTGDPVTEAAVVDKTPAPASSPEVVMPDGAEANAAIGARTIGKG